MMTHGRLIFAESAAALAAAFIAGPSLAAVTISTDTSQNISCTGGVCAPTASDAVLNVTDLENLLASGDVEVTTTGSGVQATDIDIAAALSWSATNSLTLDSYHSVTVDQTVSVQDQSGLTITTNDGGQDGELSFGQNGGITFGNLSTNLTINGATYTLANSIKTLASAIAADPSGNFAIAQSIDAQGDGVYDQAPIQTIFTGSLEGLGNSISKLRLDGYATGLMQIVDTGGSVRDLTLQGVKATPTIDFGGLVEINNGGVIAHCGASGSIKLKSNKPFDVAGLVSGNSGTIQDSWSSMRITAQRGDNVAGLVSVNTGLIERSFSTGSIVVESKKTKGSEVMGGLVASNNSGGAIIDSYTEASLTGRARLTYSTGGLVGENDGNISSSYSTGAIDKMAGYVGGLIGYDEAASGSLTDTYWDTTTSGITNLSEGAGDPSNDPGITGLSTTQFQSGLPSGFDPSIWAEDSSINNGLPYLIGNSPRT